jgi:hypothetical protein
VVAAESFKNARRLSISYFSSIVHPRQFIHDSSPATFIRNLAMVFERFEWVQVWRPRMD